MSKQLKILITGVVGFIGSNLASRLLGHNHNHIVMGIDKFDSFQYFGKPENFTTESHLRPLLIRDRLSTLINFPNFLYINCDLRELTIPIYQKICNFEPDVIIHLAATPGINVCEMNRSDSLSNNVISTSRLFEIVRQSTDKFFYASSSSVYGNTSSPLLRSKETDKLEAPLSMYALSKQLNEQAVDYYRSTNPIDFTQIVGLRFFSVYGPRGRPDMAPWKFSVNAYQNEKSYLTNGGHIIRDYTYIDDVVNAIIGLIGVKGKMPPIINIGGGTPIAISTMAKMIYEYHGKEPNLHPDTDNALDARITNADNSLLLSLLPDLKFTSKEDGIRKFVEWHKSFLKRANV